MLKKLNRKILTVLLLQAAISLSLGASAQSDNPSITDKLESDRKTLYEKSLIDEDELKDTTRIKRDQRPFLIMRSSVL